MKGFPIIKHVIIFSINVRLKSFHSIFQRNFGQTNFPPNFPPQSYKQNTQPRPNFHQEPVNNPEIRERDLLVYNMITITE